VESHGGVIVVDSELGRGTYYPLFLNFRSKNKH
jgi:signal transduction histidine kinase